MAEWEKTIEQIKDRGWSFGFVRVGSLDTGKLAWMVDVHQGESRHVVKADTMAQAVAEIEQLTGIKSA